jgi:hypothetical protein
MMWDKPVSAMNERGELVKVYPPRRGARGQITHLVEEVGGFQYTEIWDGAAWVRGGTWEDALEGATLTPEELHMEGVPHDSARELTIVAKVQTDDGKTLTITDVPPKTFSTGSRGYYATKKVAIEGKNYQLNIQLVEIGSRQR